MINKPQSKEKVETRGSRRTIAMDTEANDSKKRLAASLRLNLKKRKDQARLRKIGI